MTLASATRVVPTCGLFWLFVAQVAQAESPRFAVFASRPAAYAVSVESRVGYARRTDFTRPVFLMQQEVDRIVAAEVVTTVDFELRLVPWLAMEFVAPLSIRHADVRFSPIVISRDQVLGARWLDLNSAGLGQVTAALLFHVFEHDSLDGYARAGIVTPLDDNPGGNSVPTRLPLSSGQTKLLADASASLALAAWNIDVEYGFGYQPGNAAAYLVRRIGSQTASGAVSDVWSHRARLRVALTATELVTLALAPEWLVDQSPVAVEAGGDVPFLPEAMRHELTLEGRVALRPSANHQLELFYKHHFLGAWNKDPFFPIVIPDRGFGVTWRTRAW